MAKVETGITKNEIISLLTKSSHGKLEDYVPIGQAAVKKEPEFLAHLIAWNQLKGQIKDSKVALPIISLSVGAFAPEFVENSLAHLALLDPRMLVKALKFQKSVKTPGYTRKINELVEKYLRAREANWSWWERTAVQHRNTLKTLYSTYHIKPSTMADAILFGPSKAQPDKIDIPEGTVFKAIANLKNMSPSEAAGVILEKKIPFLVASGALGAKIKDPNIVLALLDRMTPTELVTNAKMLEKLGVKTEPSLRSAYEKAMEKAATSKKATLKTTKAAEAAEASGDTETAAKLQALQEKQLNALGGIKGDWLIIGDISASMNLAIEKTRELSAVLARMCEGSVHIMFCNESPRYFDATGKTLEQIQKETRSVNAGGGTNLGCGLQAIMDKKLNVDGIVIISDGGENRAPWFSEVYSNHCRREDRDIPVYHYLTPGDPNRLSINMHNAGKDLQKLDIVGNIDYYSMPNIVQTMRVNRFSLAQEIFDTPIMTLDEVFKPRNFAATI